MASAVLLILFVNGSVFAAEQPFEETVEDTIEQGFEVAPEGEIVTDEETSSVEAQVSSEFTGAEIPVGGEAPLAVWGGRDTEASTEPAQPSHIDSVKVDLSVDEDGQTYMPITE